MGSKHARYCGKCRTVHSGLCPIREEYLKTKWRNRPEKKSGRGGRPWRRLRQEIFERDGFLCQICLANGITKVVTFHGKLAGVCDHIIPLAQGGTDSKGNLQTICKDCDETKSKAESIQGRVGPKPHQ